jgi:hypothetical protein
MHCIAPREVTGRQSRGTMRRTQSGPPCRESPGAPPSATWLAPVRLISQARKR